MALFAKRRQEKARAELQAAYDGYCKVLLAEKLRLVEPGMREARDRARAQLGVTDVLTLELWQLHAHTLGNLGRDQEAEQEFSAVAEAAGSDAAGQQVRLLALANRAAQLCFMQRFADAEAQARDVVTAAGVLPPPHDRYTCLSGLNTRAMALIGLGRADEAEVLARDVLAEGRGKGWDIGSFKRILNVNLASALNAQGRHIEALEALAEAEQVRDPANAVSATSAIAKARATALLGLDRNAEAAAAARSGLTAALSAFGESHTRVRELRELLARAEAISA